MDETAWLICTDPRPMLEFLGSKASERKLRRFALTCCRIATDLLDQDGQLVVEEAEQHADCTIEWTAWAGEELRNRIVPRREGRMLASTRLPWRLRIAGLNPARTEYVRQLIAGIARLRHSEANDTHAALRAPHGQELQSARTAWATAGLAVAQERSNQSILLRDIFGNPFRPLPPRPEAIAPLAEQIYAGAWDQMPILGESLQEHGYWSEGEHCLDPNNQHVKGCWVVDWVTGRE